MAPLDRVGAGWTGRSADRWRNMRRYWLIGPGGSRQEIDPREVDLERLAAQADRVGARLEVEFVAPAAISRALATEPAASEAFEPPLGALGPLFCRRFERIHFCRVPFVLDVSHRATSRVLGGYYRKRRLIRIYSHDSETGRRPLEELFDTFLHEVSHHLEYTEPQSFQARSCGRVPGRMHSPLFWRIFAEVKSRWSDLQRPSPVWLEST